MHPRTSKTLALLGGIATLALGSTFMLRIATPKNRQLQVPCAPRLQELEQSECQARLPPRSTGQLAELSLHTH